MIECPRCKRPISVSKHTVSAICQCGKYIRCEDAKESSGSHCSAPMIMIKRGDRNMKIMRERVSQIETGAQKQLDRVRERKATKKT